MSIFGADGHVDITVELVGFLANTLRGYEATSILREQLQNADDACHTQQRPGELELQFQQDRLVVPPALAESEQLGNDAGRQELAKDEPLDDLLLDHRHRYAGGQDPVS